MRVWSSKKKNVLFGNFIRLCDNWYLFLSPDVNYKTIRLRSDGIAAEICKISQLGMKPRQHFKKRIFINCSLTITECHLSILWLTGLHLLTYLFFSPRFVIDCNTRRIKRMSMVLVCVLDCDSVTAGFLPEFQPIPNDISHDGDIQNAAGPNTW